MRISLLFKYFDFPISFHAMPSHAMPCYEVDIICSIHACRFCLVVPTLKSFYTLSLSQPEPSFLTAPIASKISRRLRLCPWLRLWLRLRLLAKCSSSGYSSSTSLFMRPSLIIFYYVWIAQKMKISGQDVNRSNKFA